MLIITISHQFNNVLIHRSVVIVFCRFPKFFKDRSEFDEQLRFVIELCMIAVWMKTGCCWHQLHMKICMAVLVGYLVTSFFLHSSFVLYCSYCFVLIITATLVIKFDWLMIWVIILFKICVMWIKQYWNYFDNLFAHFLVAGNTYLLQVGYF